MIRIHLRRQDEALSRNLATRRGVVEVLAMIGDFAFSTSKTDRAWIRLGTFIDAYHCDEDEGCQIVIKASTPTAEPTDIIEIRMMGAVERYTLKELRECWREVSETA